MSEHPTGRFPIKPGGGPPARRNVDWMVGEQARKERALKHGEERNINAVIAAGGYRRDEMDEVFPGWETIDDMMRIG